MSRSDLLQDLDYVRTLAEEGRTAPLIGGAHLVALGGLTALAYVGHWAIGAFGAPTFSYPALWVGYGVAMAIAGGILEKRADAKPGASAIGNRADRAVWTASTIALIAWVVGCVLNAQLRGDMALVDWIAPGAFMAYGMALMTTSLIAKDAVLRVAGVLAMLIGAGLIVLVGQPVLYLAAAAGVVICTVAPGVIQMAREPKTMV